MLSNLNNYTAAVFLKIALQRFYHICKILNNRKVNVFKNTNYPKSQTDMTAHEMVFS